LFRPDPDASLSRVSSKKERGEREKRLGARIAEVVGPKIANRREQMELSQEELADLSGLHRTAISLLELGKRAPRIVTLYVIAGVLEIPPGDLLAGIYWERVEGDDDGQFSDEPPDESAPLKR
jgi:transcriptional regulator with XRE-family HTH domain